LLRLQLYSKRDSIAFPLIHLHAILHTDKAKKQFKKNIFAKDIKLAMENCKCVATALNNIAAMNLSGAIDKGQ
jgi:hypothetical protein